MEQMTCKECGRVLPETKFKATRWGRRASVCTDCATAKRKSNSTAKHEMDVNEAKAMRLRDFTPRELMEELVRRGYEGKLKYTIVQEIDITNF